MTRATRRRMIRLAAENLRWRRFCRVWTVLAALCGGKDVLLVA